MSDSLISNNPFEASARAIAEGSNPPFFTGIPNNKKASESSRSGGTDKNFMEILNNPL